MIRTQFYKCNLLKDIYKEYIYSMKSLTDICKEDLIGCSYVTEHGSDKLDWHAYMPVYEERLETYRDSAERVLEVGVQGGGSIVMWQKYFTNANIVGVEWCGSEVLREKSRQLLDDSKSCIHWNTDGYNPQTVEMLRQYGSFDIVIDDGPHTIESQCYFALHYSQLVKVGGLVIVEDIDGLENAQKIKNSLPDYMEGEIVDLLHVNNRYDDIMVFAKRIR